MKNKIVTINYDLRKVSAKEINNIIPHLKESVNEELPEVFILIVPEGVTVSPIVTFLNIASTEVIKK